MSYILDISRLSFEGDFDTQMARLIKYIRMSKTEIEQLQILFDDLQNVFEKFWPGSRLNIFGSIVTGLAIKTSDVDILVALPPSYTQSSAAFVVEAYTKLCDHSNFQKLQAITRGKVPIVKFYHSPTQRYCDVSCSGPIAHKITMWLEYMISLDERILPLALIVKYWSKIHNFTDSHIMSNYCLTLLVIFYLQQKCILPSTILLQQGVSPDFTDNWNTAFHEINHKTTNTEGVYELLGGFFQYYQDFKFNEYILSLYTGKTIEKKQFVNTENISLEYDLYCANLRNNYCTELPLQTLMCVQDPFNHSRNVGVTVNPKRYEIILSHFKKAAGIFETRSSDDFLKHLLHTDAPHSPVHPRTPRYANTNQNRGIKKNYKKWIPRTDNRKNTRFSKLKFNDYRNLRKDKW